LNAPSLVKRGTARRPGGFLVGYAGAAALSEALKSNATLTTLY
jgi:hypothetical protein